MNFITLHDRAYGGEISLRDDTVVAVKPAQYVHWGTYITVNNNGKEETYNVRENPQEIKKLLLSSWCPPPAERFGDPDELARFDVIGELYYRRTGRMRPGKSEPMATGHDSAEKANVHRFELWMKELAFTDAIDYIIELEDRI